MKNKAQFVLRLSFLILAAFYFTTPSTILAAKVNLSSNSATLSEGSGSQVFSITLDEPIITMEEEGYVILNITGDDARLSFSTSSIYFAASDWLNTRTLTLSVSNDSIQNSDNSAIVTIQVVSNSEYYSGYSRTISITIVDDDVVQSVSQTSVGPSGGSSIIYGCRDITAKNYDRFSAHNQALCVYLNRAPNSFASSSTIIPMAIYSTSTSVYSTYVDIKNITRILSRGMQSKDVLILQRFLVTENKGQYAKALAKVIKTTSAITTTDTGYFGSLTQQTLLEWQLYMKIKPTGIFDATTREAVLKI
jgi:peptidoglycan hydrolase-like protein with peptidoglycan-binding domain